MGQEAQIENGSYALLQASSRPNANQWTEIGQAVVVPTFWGRARVRVIRESDGLRRAIWMAAGIMLLTILVAWQSENLLRLFGLLHPLEQPVANAPAEAAAPVAAPAPVSAVPSIAPVAPPAAVSAAVKTNVPAPGVVAPKVAVPPVTRPHSAVVATVPASAVPATAVVKPPVRAAASAVMAAPVGKPETAVSGVKPESTVPTVKATDAVNPAVKAPAN